MAPSNISVAILTLLGIVSFIAVGVSGHGRLINPPARSSLWRERPGLPINYDDNQLFCGGFERQLSLGYKCGICGDPYDGERLHEAGGLYATGTIARTYRQGQRVVFQVDVTANHMGYFEFRICPTNSPDIKATKECLDQNLLVVDDHGATRYYLENIGAYLVNVTVRLPANLNCDFCVVQWRYHTQNSWGTDDDGTSCVGCGPQEEFYGCADVRILSNGGTVSSQPPASTTTATPSISTTASTTYGQSMSSSSTTATTSEPITSTISTTSTTTTSTTTAGSGSQTCRSHSGAQDMNNWCAINCQAPVRNCPSHLCTCESGPSLTCVGVGAFRDNVLISDWCRNNCGMGFCPEHLCSCNYSVPR